MNQNNAPETTLWCVHGNLQLPTVWDGFQQRLRLRDTQLKVTTIDLWQTLTADFWSWSTGICTSVRSLSSSSAKRYFLGYSLGGRLGLHGLIQQPDLWAGAIIVSADPGIADAKNKKLCLRRDRIWANRFLTEPWDDLLAEWDALPVFCNRPCPTPRPEADFDRQKIARAFEVYSKGRMDDLRSQITNLPIPITYVTGYADHRYQQIGTELTAQSSNIRHVSIQNAGHRVPWEQPDAFLDILTDVLA